MDEMRAGIFNCVALNPHLVVCITVVLVKDSLVGTVPEKLFEVFFVILFVILFVVHFIIFINILTELILKIGFGASIGCREREENAQDFLMEVVLDVTGVTIVASTIRF
jgi:hypothetical protein